jgi:hypothetical protein
VEVGGGERGEVQNDNGMGPLQLHITEAAQSNKEIEIERSRESYAMRLLISSLGLWKGPLGCSGLHSLPKGGGGGR